MTPITSRIAAIEKAVHKAGFSMRQFLIAAGVNESQWSRWKNDGQKPLLENWTKVEEAAARLPKKKRRAA